MYPIRLNNCALVIFTGIFLCSFTANAMDIRLEPTVGVSTEYTDNSKLTENGELRELITTTYVGVNLDAGSGPFQLNANSTLKYLDYMQSTFTNRRYLNLNATAKWDMWKNRLDWKLQDFVTQQSMDSLSPDTPDNTQHVNVLTFGPNIYFPISGRQKVTLRPEYRKFNYHNDHTYNNQQNSLTADWNYQIYRTINIGFTGGTNEVDYSDPTISDNESSNIHFTISGQRLRFNYSGKLGSTYIENETGSEIHGITGDMIWVYNISDHSNLRTYIATDLTDTSNNLLNASINPENGDISNDQITTEILRNSIIRLAYQNNDPRLNTSIWLELRRQNYTVAMLDRDVQAAGIAFNYPITAMLSTGINTRYSRTELADTDRKDNLFNISGNINYRFSRRLLGSAELKYNKKYSTLDTAEFNEFRVLFSLAYKYGG